MTGAGDVCRFQAILFEYKGEPLRVLEEHTLPADECSLDVAKVMYMQRF